MLQGGEVEKQAFENKTKRKNPTENNNILTKLNIQMQNNQQNKRRWIAGHPSLMKAYGRMRKLDD